MKINFVCWGNICRSPMAEYIFKSLDVEHKYEVISSAISNEEYGNDIQPPAKDVLNKNNIKYNTHHAHKITKEEYEQSDYIIVMEDYHIEKLYSMYGKSNKVHPLITILAVFAGGILFGILGIVISLPVTIILITTIKFYAEDISDLWEEVRGKKD